MLQFLSKKFKKIVNLGICFPVFIFLSVPASTNYQLKSFEFGGGSTGNSSNYGTESTVGEIAGKQTSANYSAHSGLIFVQQANVPAAPTFVNSSNWYNKLKLTIATSNNPSDTKYAVAISTDNFSTTNYVQSDNTIGAALGLEDFQTYTSWGGASGFFVIGLARNTTYYVKVKARQGQYTESPWGPVASATTSDVSLNIDLDVSSSNSETAGPYSVSLGSLSAGNVTTATNKVWIDLDTNAEAGGFVYIYDTNAGLRSSHTNYTISSASTDLTGATEGYGIRIDSTTVTQSSGGPFTAIAPYNGSNENVGLVNSTIRELFSTGSNPIVGGRGAFFVKAKISSITPASTDYTDTLTIIASATF